MSAPQIKHVGHYAMVFDRDQLDEVYTDWFEPSYWRARNRVSGAAPGRGSAVFIQPGDDTWVLRHYHRGGFMSRLINDVYFWHGTESTRAFREWRLLADLYDSGLPVPRPIAARVCRTGLSYTADILTVYIDATESVDAMLHAGKSLGDQWQVIGSTLRRFHDRGVDHSDLNVRNILVDATGRVYLVDFDKGRLRSPGAWRRRNLQRLQRSLRKTALETGVPYDETVWQRIEAGYADGE
jgi:3-deoxy-D-manno-octulosonic acid kinase